MQRCFGITSFMFVILVSAMVCWFAEIPLTGQAPHKGARQLPVFQVAPSWPKIPNGWVLGEVSSIAVDRQDHVWLLQRPRTVKPEDKSKVAPPVLEFDASGNYIQGWGGPGQGYEWPEMEHGIHVDYKGYVWIGGNGMQDDQLLKFTKTGKLVMQIGHSGQSKGNKDTKNLNRPADAFVYPKTNEVFVADGYGNRRIIVFDADTGAFKRMWGAFGNAPSDTAPAEEDQEKGSEQFNTIHAARVSNDGLVYVSDRANKRLQVFTIQGKFLSQVFIDRDCRAPECGNGQTAAATVFSPDPEQRFLYIASLSPERVIVLDRKTLEILGSFGKLGTAPGEFHFLHHMAADSKGNIYTAEINPNRRAQKFVFKGMSSSTSAN